MSARRPLQVTSRRHPYAVVVFVAYGVWGGTLLAGVAQSDSVNRALDQPYRDILASTLLCGALAGLIGISWKRLDLGFSLEAGGVLALAAGNFTVAVAAFVYQDSLVGTAIICASVASGSLWRVRQIVVEATRIREAMADPRPTEPPPISEAPTSSADGEGP